MFEDALFSLRSLLVFCPLVRGGEGAVKSWESEFPSNPDEGTKDAILAWDGASWPDAWKEFGGASLGEASFAEGATRTVFEGLEGIACTWSSTAFNSWSSNSYKTSNFFFVFWRRRFCERCWILRWALMLWGLRLLSLRGSSSIDDRLELCIFGSRRSCCFLWFYKLGATFGKVAVYMTKVAFEWNLLII